MQHLSQLLIVGIIIVIIVLIIYKKRKTQEEPVETFRGGSFWNNLAIARRIRSIRPIRSRKALSKAKEEVIDELEDIIEDNTEKINQTDDVNIAEQLNNEINEAEKMIETVEKINTVESYNAVLCGIRGSADFNQIDPKIIPNNRKRKRDVGSHPKKTSNYKGGDRLRACPCTGNEPQITPLLPNTTTGTSYARHLAQRKNFLTDGDAILAGSAELTSYGNPAEDETVNLPAQTASFSRMNMDYKTIESFDLGKGKRRF